jgi:large subunit ribosomal protein L6
MSRVGKLPIPVPKGVEVNIATESVSVKGPLGTLTQLLTKDVRLKKDGDSVVVEAAGSDRSDAMSGTIRAIVANMVAGVTKGFERRLALVGVGYRAQAQGDKLNLTLGFSHPVVYAAPEGITIETPSQTEIIVKGSDVQKVGQVAADIRTLRKPEPYKGKGVRYAGERILRKAGKAGKK